MPTPELDTLLRAIKTEDDQATEAAAGALFLDNADTLHSLLELAAAGGPDERWWAVRALSMAAESAAGQRRELALAGVVNGLTDPDESVRCLAALALGKLKAADAVPALTPLLADSSGWVRGAAADGLAMIGEPAVPALGEALHDDREGVRVRAAYALHRIRSVSSARWLFPALADPNPIVHTHVYEALDEMGLLNTLLVQ